MQAVGVPVVDAGPGGAVAEAGGEDQVGIVSGHASRALLVGHSEVERATPPDLATFPVHRAILRA